MSIEINEVLLPSVDYMEEETDVTTEHVGEEEVDTTSASLFCFHAYSR